MNPATKFTRDMERTRYREGRLINLVCKAVGHDLPDKVTPVFSNTGKWRDELGNVICYHCRLCGRCGKRVPIDEENAVEKAKKNAETAAIMNGARARYGLGPLSWED